MSYLTAFVIVVGCIAAIDLVLTLGVIRRLRHHAELISSGGSAAASRARSLPPAGEQPTEFTATTVEHETIDRDTFGDLTLVGFFSPSCAPCREQIEPFVDYAAAMPTGHQAALAVVVGTAAETAEFVERLRSVARVVVEPPGGAVSAAFDVDALPAVGLVATGGVVVKSAFSMSELPALEVA